MKLPRDRVFVVTGASGNLGFAVVRRLVEETTARVIAVVRSSSAPGFARCLAARLPDVGPDRVALLTGDLGAPMLGLDPESLALAGVTDVVHCAADVRWHGAASELLATNVGGARHVLELAHRLDRRRRLARVTMVSSAYVSGRADGPLPERAIAAPAFNNAYEASKLLAERLALTCDTLPVTVVRPSILVGDARDGAIQNFSTLYYPFRMVQKRKLAFLPGHADARLDLVPTDHAAEIIHAVHESSLPTGSIVHACAGDRGVTVPELWRVACEAFDAIMPENQPRTPGRIIAPALVHAVRPFAFLMKPKAREMLRKLLLFMPYLRMRRTFATDQARALGVAPPPHFAGYARALCAYAVDAGYRPASERWVAPPIETPARIRKGA